MSSAVLLILGTASGLFLCAMLIWSILRPGRRVWPIARPTAVNQLLVWTPTAIIFATTIMLGLLHWNALGWPAVLRYGLGGGLVVAGNLVLLASLFWTGGQSTTDSTSPVQTGGLYRWSRNPLYVGDLMILVGAGILMATLWTVPVILAGIAAVILAPFAEEPWMQHLYGADYDAYRATTRRFI